MATAYRPPLCSSCSALMAEVPHYCHRNLAPHPFLLNWGLPEARRVLAPSTHLLYACVKQKTNKGKEHDQQRIGKVFCTYYNIPKVVTATTWKISVLQSESPVLVEFWAAWCGPCRMVDRVIEEIALEYAGRVGCFKLDADRFPQIAIDHGIERVPTVLLFKHGEKLESITGTMPKYVYVTAIEKSLASSSS